METIKEELKKPYVTQELVDYLNTCFNLDACLCNDIKNLRQFYGYCKGIRDVINHLAMLAEEGKGE